MTQSAAKRTQRCARQGSSSELRLHIALADRPPHGVNQRTLPGVLSTNLRTQDTLSSNMYNQLPN